MDTNEDDGHESPAGEEEPYVLSLVLIGVYSWFAVSCRLPPERNSQNAQWGNYKQDSEITLGLLCVNALTSLTPEATWDYIKRYYHGGAGN